LFFCFQIITAVEASPHNRVATDAASQQFAAAAAAMVEAVPSQELVDPVKMKGKGFFKS
jgi:hypothetical protein